MRIPKTRLLVNTNPAFKTEGTALTSLSIPDIKKIRIFKSTVLAYIGEEEYPVQIYYPSDRAAKICGSRIHDAIQEWERYSEKVRQLELKSSKVPASVTMIQGAPQYFEEEDEDD